MSVRYPAPLSARFRAGLPGAWNTPLTTQDLVAEASDAITFGDSAVALTSRVADAADTVAFTDSAVAVATLVSTASDTIAFSDSAAGLVAFPAEASDTVSFSDTAEAITSRVAAATDSLALSDSADAITSRVAEASDTATFSDSAEAFTSGIIAAAADTVAFTDAADATTSRTADASDTVAFTDEAQALSTLVATASDTVSFGDSAIAALGSQTITVSASDSITFSDSAVAEIEGQSDIATDPKLIARKRKPNQNITFKGAGGQAPRKKREEKPEPVKAKASPLLLGLMARGLAMPTPPMLPEPAPALDVASIAEAVLLEALPAAIEEPKPEVPPTPEQLLQARVEQLEQQVMQMQADLAVLRQPVMPAQASARDPVLEALHAIVPAIADPIDIDAVPEEPEAPEEPAAAAPAPAQPAGMTREEIEAENERRARLAAERLL